MRPQGRRRTSVVTAFTGLRDRSSLSVLSAIKALSSEICMHGVVNGRR